MAPRLTTLFSFLITLRATSVLADCTPGPVSGTSCRVECGVDYPGGDYGAVRVDNFAACVATCAADTTCVDANYHIPTNYCYLKNSLTRSSPNSNVNAVICRAPSSSTTTTTTTKPVTTSTTTNPVTTTTTTKPVTTTTTTTTTPASNPTTCPALGNKNLPGSGGCGCSYSVQCDFYGVGGNEQQTTTESSEAACRKQCDQYNNCDNYRYNFASKECVLVQGYLDGTNEPGYVSGFLTDYSCKQNKASCPQVPGTCNEQLVAGGGSCQCLYHEFCSGSTFGKPLSTTTVDSIETCRKRCDTFNNCYGYRLVRSNNQCTIFAFDNNTNYIGPVGRGFYVGFQEDSPSYPNCRRSCSAYTAGAKFKFA